MPKNKDLKRLARARMKKTGEAYTTARARLLEKAKERWAADVADLAQRAGTSEKTVVARTGRGWGEWVRLLDAAGAESMPHREIAALIRDRFEVSGWWAQTVTVGYERIRGLREIGQRRDGTRELNKSRTVPAPLAKLYRACRVARTRRRWLPGVEPTVRTAVREKSMRWTWPDGTSVHLYFVDKGAAKSQVSIQHVKLATRSDVERMREYWQERLSTLAELLQAPS